MRHRFLVGVLALGLLALAGYGFLAPFLTLRGLAAAVERKEVQALERYVDFPRVREALKADLSASLMKEMQNEENPFAALGLLFTAGMVNVLVDALLTPEGLASLGTGKEPGQASLEEVRNWRLRYLGLSRAFIYHKDDPRSGLVLERQGLRWRVVRLQMPLD
ncbi:DUF2939 domain-containing protein [Thermus caliditerrae]|uniref:DUF2939 domain-containing protein n=1 Tax=Thermus caliditerrae TaxID=1330700 RepID=UPI00056E2B55|nr:DUF2939 domain-containing protein [Thermus caliditerrae]